MLWRFSSCCSSSHQQQNPTAKFVGQGVFSSVVLAGSMQYVSADIRQWRVVAVVRFFVSLQGGRAIWPWCTSRRRRMGDVVEQPVGNAKATFSSDAASQGQQTTRAAKRRGFCCCWPSIARSAKFLQTTQVRASRLLVKQKEEAQEWVTQQGRTTRFECGHNSPKFCKAPPYWYHWGQSCLQLQHIPSLIHWIQLMHQCEGILIHCQKKASKQLPSIVSYSRERSIKPTITLNFSLWMKELLTSWWSVSRFSQLHRDTNSANPTYKLDVMFLPYWVPYVDGYAQVYFTYWNSSLRSAISRAFCLCSSSTTTTWAVKFRSTSFAHASDFSSSTTPCSSPTCLLNDPMHMTHNLVFSLYKSPFFSLLSSKGNKKKSRRKVCTFPVATPTLAKCGGEAQHFQSWGFGVLSDSRMFRIQQQGPKHLTLRFSWCHWKGLEA